MARSNTLPFKVLGMPVESGFSAVFPPTKTKHPTESKLEGFARLARGWHFGEGDGFCRGVVQAVKELNREAISLSFPETDVFPGLNGDIVLAIYRNSHCLEFIVDSTCRVDVCEERHGREVASREDLSVREAKQEIRRFRERLCRSFGLSASSSITIEDVAVSQAWRSNLPVSLLVYQYSDINAFETPGTPSADTYGTSIPEALAGIGQPTGPSQQKIFPILTA